MNATLVERKTAEVLYVEDNDDDILLVQNLLGSRGIQVTGAQNLTTARELLSGRKFDLVLLDHVLPDGNGLSFIEELWWCYPDVPVILITGRKDESLALAAIRKGATNFVLKDEIKEDLYPTLVESLGWRQSEEAAAIGVSDWHIPPDATDKLTPWLEPYHAPKKEPGSRFLHRASEFYQTMRRSKRSGSSSCSSGPWGGRWRGRARAWRLCGRSRSSTEAAPGCGPDRGAGRNSSSRSRRRRGRPRRAG